MQPQAMRALYQFIRNSMLNKKKILTDLCMNIFHVQLINVRYVTECYCL